MPTAPSNPIATIPWTDSAEIALSPFGVALEGPDVIGDPLQTTFERASETRGIGIWTENDGRIRAAISTHCYIGAKLGSSDSRITDSDLYNNRDACLWIARDAGNCRSMGNQFYGSRVAVYNEGGEGYQSTADRIEDSYIGALCDAKSKFFGTFLQQHLVRCCVLRGGSCELHSCEIRVQRETREHNVFSVGGLPSYSGTAGVEFIGGGGRMFNCKVALDNWCHPANTPSGKPATGIIIGADDCDVQGEIEEQDGCDGTRGIFIDGPRRDVSIAFKARGFHAPADRLLVANNKCQLDATLAFEFRKPWRDYIDLVPGWSGRVRVWNKVNGDLTSLTQGKAA